MKNVGDKVRLNKFGKEMQKPHKKIGTIIKKCKAGTTDYTIEVLWSDGKKECMHEHQVDNIQTAPANRDK